MKLKCLGSGSSGNCYILENDSEALILDAGIPMTDAKIALNFNIRKIVGVICSHGHGDHVGFVKDYLSAGIPVFMPHKKYEKIKRFGRFHIQPFSVEHDVPCYGFMVKHPDYGKLIYATDTEYVKYRFKNLDAIIIEANYSKRLLSERGFDSPNRGHVLTGHMALETTLEFLKVNKTANLRNVILAHLSNHNAEPEQFKSATEKIVNCPVHVATKGLDIDIGLPF